MSPNRWKQEARTQILERVLFYIRNKVTENAVELQILLDIFFNKVTSATKGIILYYI
jgi:hypothetical protein